MISATIAVCRRPNRVAQSRSRTSSVETPTRMAPNCSSPASIGRRTSKRALGIDRAQPAAIGGVLHDRPKSSCSSITLPFELGRAVRDRDPVGTDDRRHRGCSGRRDGRRCWRAGSTGCRRPRARRRYGSRRRRRRDPEARWKIASASSCAARRASPRGADASASPGASR